MERYIMVATIREDYYNIKSYVMYNMDKKQTLNFSEEEVIELLMDKTKYVKNLELDGINIKCTDGLMDGYTIINDDNVVGLSKVVILNEGEEKSEVLLNYFDTDTKLVENDKLEMITKKGRVANRKLFIPEIKGIREARMPDGNFEKNGFNMSVGTIKRLDDQWIIKTQHRTILADDITFIASMNGCRIYSTQEINMANMSIFVIYHKNNKMGFVELSSVGDKFCKPMELDNAKIIYLDEDSVYKNLEELYADIGKTLDGIKEINKTRKSEDTIFTNQDGKKDKVLCLILIGSDQLVAVISGEYNGVMVKYLGLGKGYTLDVLMRDQSEEVVRLLKEIAEKSNTSSIDEMSKSIREVTALDMEYDYKEIKIANRNKGLFKSVYINEDIRFVSEQYRNTLSNLSDKVLNITKDGKLLTNVPAIELTVSNKVVRYKYLKYISGAFPNISGLMDTEVAYIRDMKIEQGSTYKSLDKFGIYNYARGIGATVDAENRLDIDDNLILGIVTDEKNREYIVYYYKYKFVFDLDKLIKEVDKVSHSNLLKVERKLGLVGKMSINEAGLLVLNDCYEELVNIENGVRGISMCRMQLSSREDKVMEIEKIATCYGSRSIKYVGNAIDTCIIKNNKFKVETGGRRTAIAFREVILRGKGLKSLGVMRDCYIRNLKIEGSVSELSVKGLDKALRADNIIMIDIQNIDKKVDIDIELPKQMYDNVIGTIQRCRVVRYEQQTNVLSVMLNKDVLHGNALVKVHSSVLGITNKISLIGKLNGENYDDLIKSATKILDALSKCIEIFDESTDNQELESKFKESDWAYITNDKISMYGLVKSKWANIQL